MWCWDVGDCSDDRSRVLQRQRNGRWCNLEMMDKQRLQQFNQSLGGHGGEVSWLDVVSGQL